jgi:hypothetical protein
MAGSPDDREMNDGPTADDLPAKLFRYRVHTGDWRVEKMDEDGGPIEGERLAHLEERFQVDFQSPKARL